MTNSTLVIEPGMRIHSSLTSATYRIKSVDLVKCRAIAEREDDGSVHQLDTDVLHHSILVGNARVLLTGERANTTGECSHAAVETCLLLTGTGIWCKLCGDRLYNRENSK